MPAFQTLDSASFRDQTVLLRADLNVPMHHGEISDRTRLTRLAPTILELSDQGATVALLSHFGRPKGKWVAEMSLRPVANALERILKRPVLFADDCIGPAAEAGIAAAGPGGIVVLENSRFYPQEEANDPGFANQLAELGDAYVNDAFSAAHRAHATTEGLARLLPAYAGRLMQAELENLDQALTTPEHPVAAIVGGAKISTKLDLLHNLVNKVDVLIIGGGMANTFLAAQGVDVKNSLCEHDLAETARTILAEAKAAHCDIVLPRDATVAWEFAAEAKSAEVLLGEIPKGSMILDIGPLTIAYLLDLLKRCKTLVWNGPLGAFELSPFDSGTVAIAQQAAVLTERGVLRSVAGGGDTVAALAKADALDAFSYVSTAGGAFLEWLEGKTLPGVQALIDNA